MKDTSIIERNIITYLNTMDDGELYMGGITPYDIINGFDGCDDKKEAFLILKKLEGKGYLKSWKDKKGEYVFDMTNKPIRRNEIAKGHFPRFGENRVHIMGETYYLKIDAIFPAHDGRFDTQYGVVILACDSNYANAKPLVNIYHGGHITTEYFDISPFQIAKGRINANEKR